MALPLVSPSQGGRNGGRTVSNDFTKIKNEMLRLSLSRQQVDHEVKLAQNRVALLKRKIRACNAEIIETRGRTEQIVEARQKRIVTSQELQAVKRRRDEAVVKKREAARRERDELRETVAAARGAVVLTKRHEVAAGKKELAKVFSKATAKRQDRLVRNKRHIASVKESLMSQTLSTTLSTTRVVERRRQKARAAAAAETKRKRKVEKEIALMRAREAAVAASAKKWKEKEADVQAQLRLHIEEKRLGSLLSQQRSNDARPSSAAIRRKL